MVTLTSFDQLIEKLDTVENSLYRSNYLPELFKLADELIMRFNNENEVHKLMGYILSEKLYDIATDLSYSERGIERDIYPTYKKALILANLIFDNNDKRLVKYIKRNLYYAKIYNENSLINLFEEQLSSLI